MSSRWSDRSLRARLREYLARRLDVADVPFGLERLKARGFIPEMIFDVGAYDGAFARLCDRFWPGASVVCFEVQPHAVASLQSLSKANPCITVMECLLGAAPHAAVPLHLRETATSVLKEQAGDDAPVRSFPMRTVDDVVTQTLSGRAPAFLKMDVQGYELEVLKGAEKTLPGIDAILAEVNWLDLHEGVPLLADLVAWLDARGFVAYDLCGVTRRPLDNALWQTDFLFVPKTSRLRADKRWSA